MVFGDYYPGSTYYYSNYLYCSLCNQYYIGLHSCTYSYQPLPTVYWTTCLKCQQYYNTSVGHVCAQQLEAKPRYEDHTLECGCKVKTVVVEHCETLHKAPEEECPGTE